MLLLRSCLLLGFLLLTQLSWAQTAFSANWGFEQTTAGNSSTPLVTANAMQTANVTIASVLNIAYPMGQVGRNINVQGWMMGACNAGEYVDFTVTPKNGATITLTSFSFFFAQSPTGPQQVSVRSSTDGFSTDLFAATVTPTFQATNISLSGAGFINQTGPVTIRIFACNSSNNNGALKLDEVNINGSVLPVELLYFNAQLISDRVELAWATVWERDAERFVIERSRDLLEFGTLGSVLAKGTTDQTQRYTFTYLFPDGGTTYYRLKQVDYNGATAYSKPVAVIVDDHTPTLTILGNPVDGQAIRVAVRNLPDATFTILTATGQVMPLQSQTVANGLLLKPVQVLVRGCYWLRAEQRDFSISKAIVVY